MALSGEAREYVENTVNKYSLNSGEMAYRADFIQAYLSSFDYGIEEAVVSGTRFRYPHQLGKQLTCGEAGVYVYMMAKAAGLDPRLFRLTETRGIHADHFFVDVDVDGQRQALDPMMQVRGPVKYRAGKINVRRRKSLTYKEIEYMSEDDIADFIDHINSKEGIMDYLAVTQRIRTQWRDNGIVETYVSFSPEKGFVVHNVPQSLEKWSIVHNYILSEPLHIESFYGRGEMWGEIRQPFFASNVSFFQGHQGHMFFPENNYYRLEGDVTKVLLYRLCVIAAENLGQGDGNTIRSFRDLEGAKAIAEVTKYSSKKALRFSSQLTSLEDKNPEYSRRYMDYILWKSFDYPKARRKRKALARRGGRSIDVDDMLVTHRNLLLSSMAEEWMYLYGDQVIGKLNEWVEEATGKNYLASEELVKSVT